MDLTFDAAVYTANFGETCARAETHEIQSIWGEIRSESPHYRSDFNKALLRGDVRKLASVPTTSAAGAEVLYGIAIFVAGRLSAGVLQELGKDIWTLVKRATSKVVDLWQLRAKETDRGSRRPRVEVSIFEEIQGASTMKIQLSIAGDPGDVNAMLIQAAELMVHVVHKAETEGFHLIRINENCFDVTNRLCAASVYLKPPDQIDRHEGTAFRTIQLVKNDTVP